MTSTPTDHEKRELKTCPFCGTEPEYKSDGGFNAVIRCPQCRQSRVEANWYGGDLGTTEASWNRRTAPTPQSTLFAECVELIEIIVETMTARAHGQMGLSVSDQEIYDKARTLLSKLRAGEK